jgi:hypothetical protein
LRTKSHKIKTINSLGSLADNIAYSHNGIQHAAARLLGITITPDNNVWINGEFDAFEFNTHYAFSQSGD